MIKYFLLVALAAISFSALSQDNYTPHPSINPQNIEKERGKKNLNLEQLLHIIEDSITFKNKVIIPKGLTEFERALLVGRRIQHNDSQMVAVKIFNYLLEFEFYRTKGEELYLKLLIGNSIKYIGAPLVSYNYTKEVFPAIFKEIKSKNLKAFFLNHHSNLLTQIDSFKIAKKYYLQNIETYEELDSAKDLYNTWSNLGYTYYRLNNNDSARYYYQICQQPKYKELNPILYAFSFGNYASVLQDENKLDSALFYLKKEMNQLHLLETEVGLHNIYAGIGMVFQKLNKLDSSQIYFNKALAISTKNKSIRFIANDYQQLLELYALRTKSPKLSRFLEEFNQNNKILKEEISQKIVRDEIQLSKFMDVFKETENSRRRSQELLADNRQLINISIALTVIIFLLVLILIYRIKNRRRLRENNATLEKINKELNGSNEKNSESSKRNEILLKELHHRVKNNLQIVSSLFSLQLNVKTLDLQTKEVFKDAKSRIQSISLAHKRMYQSNNFEKLDFKDYLKAFTDDLIASNPNNVSINIDVDKPPISINTAIPLGLIFNELFTNSLKHSKKENVLEISIEFNRREDGDCIVYRDNGVGVKDIKMMKENKDSIGVTLIHLLAEQLDATIKYKEADEENKGFWISVQGNFE